MTEARCRARDEFVITGTCLKELIKTLSSKVFLRNEVVKSVNPPPVLYFNPDFYAEGNLFSVFKGLVEQCLQTSKFILRTKTLGGVLCFVLFCFHQLKLLDEWGTSSMKP